MKLSELPPRVIYITPDNSLTAERGKVEPIHPAYEADAPRAFPLLTREWDQVEFGEMQ